MSNSKLKNKTVGPAVQEVQCPVSGIYFSSIGVDVHAQILVCHSPSYDPDSKSLFESDMRFGTSRQQLELFAQWIIEKNPEVVLMESTGKRKSGSSPKGNPYLRTYLAEVVQAIGLMKTTETQLRVCFQALKERRRHNRAVIAIGHKVVRVTYAMITKDEPYVEKDCHILKAVRLARLVNSIRKAPEVELAVNGASVVDLKSGQIYKT